MYYWSDEKVDAIVQSTSTLDTIINLLPKSTYAACAYTVSATSYAMLSIMENGGSAASLNKQVDPIQRFLQEQHMWVGGFSSSQVNFKINHLFDLFQSNVLAVKRFKHQY